MKGLYNKYTIINNETGKEIDGRYFVIKPDKDHAAREALRSYAKVTNNKELANDLLHWANHEFVPCGCRGLADCNHWNGGYYRVRDEVKNIDPTESTQAE